MQNVSKNPKIEFPDNSIIDRLNKAALALRLAQEAWAEDHGQSYVMEGMRDAENQITQVLNAIGLPNVWAW